MWRRSIGYLVLLGRHRVLPERRTGEPSWWDKGTREASVELLYKLGQEVARKKGGCQSVAQTVLDAAVQTPGGCSLHRPPPFPLGGNLGHAQAKHQLLRCLKPWNLNGN